MRKIFNTIILLVFFSCTNNPNSKNLSKADKIITVNVDMQSYHYWESSQDTAFKQNGDKYFLKLKEVDSVFVYSYLDVHDYTDDTFTKAYKIKILPNKLEYIWKYDKNPKLTLSKNQISNLLSIINSDKSYKVGRSDCFYPTNCFVFYNNKNQIIGYYEICFKCSQIDSKPVFRSANKNSLSDQGDSLLLTFCKQIGVRTKKL
jgi:hypothetical protein